MARKFWLVGQRHTKPFSPLLNHSNRGTYCLRSFSLDLWQEAQLSQRDPRDAVSVKMLSYCVVRIMQTDCVSAWSALSATATFSSATRVVLCTHRCNRLNYRTASMRCSVSHACHAEVSRTCDKQTWRQPKFDHHQRCWWHRVFLRQRTVMEADHHGCSVLFFSRPRSEGWPHHGRILHLCLSSVNSDWLFHG